ncbi:17998_t:CDS:2 [Funneliformis geosporum]|uniref:6735_t:CDS:1 n=1 Tax=Funneliformis geosporum TaxID=1117311 RepID=A0A9W4SFW2_9GLOM|nr:17998_t:CDS:2 [Funneliformis geosporum]CAI2168071.1 6735_t:CDS:2 [Funneliformis geosporum]
MRLNTPFSIVCKTEISPTPSTTQILCSCDFRINIYDCPESSILVISHWVLFPYCALLSATAAACLWHLLKKKNQPFFFTSRRDRGKLRPRPQHTYFTIALIYCPCQMLHSILLLTNSYPNILWAEIGHSLPSTLSATIAVLYPLSIFYSTSAFEVTNFTSRPISTSSAISEIPIARHAVRIDIVCILAFITTLGVFLTVPALTGYYADMSDFINANKFLKIQYIAWFIWVSLYVAAMIWFWSRFLNIIGEMTNQNQTQNPGLQIKLDQLRRGSRNLSLPVYGQILTGFIYLPAFLAYVLYHRSTTMFNYKINLIFLSLWNFLIPIILHITQWIMIYNIYKSITASQNIPKKLSTRNFNNNNNSRAGGEPNTNESTIYQVNEGRNIKKEKRITMTSASEGKMNVDDIELSEFIRTPIDKAIDEEEIYDIEISEVGIPRGEDFMIDSGHCSSGMVLNRDSGRVSISSNSFTKKCKSDSFLNTLHENGIIVTSSTILFQSLLPTLIPTFRHLRRRYHIRLGE